MLWALRLYPLGTQWPGSAFYFRGLATLSRIGFDAGRNKVTFEAIVLIHFRCDKNYEPVTFYHIHNTASVILVTSEKLKKHLSIPKCYRHDSSNNV